jgi:CBS-domain-containing membrane protein
MRPDATPVHAVMTENVCWCFADDSVEDIERAMARRKIRRMPVVDARKRLVGMLALGDLAAQRAPGAERVLRSVSEPSEPNRTQRPAATGGSPIPPWPPYGERLPRG